MTGGRDARLVALFLEAMVAERGASQNTVTAYRRDLEDYVSAIAALGKGPEAAERSDVESWLAGLDDLGLAASTRARRLSAVRQFHRFLYEDGWREDDPAARLSGPAKTRKLPKTLTIEEVGRLLDASRQDGDARLACLMEVLYATGMRVSELVSLPVAAVRGDPRMILVRGKGGKERMTPLSAPARAAMGAWLSVRDAAEAAKKERSGDSSRYLFPSSGAKGHLTRERLFQIVKRVAAKAGIDPVRVSPHVLRHAFASHLLANGADLRAIQQLLCHADVATTEIYTHVQEERLKRLVADKHPLAG